MTPTKPVKERKSQEENANDFCRLLVFNLKINLNSVIFIKVPNIFVQKIYLNLQVARNVKARH